MAVAMYLIDVSVGLLFIIEPRPIALLSMLLLRENPSLQRADQFYEFEGSPLFSLVHKSMLG
jgi:hypothetical protein